MESEVPLWLKWRTESLARLRYFRCLLSHSGYWHSVSSVVTDTQRRPYQIHGWMSKK